MFGALRSPRNIVFGNGHRFALGRYVAKLGARALVVTDARMAGDANFAAMVATIRSAGVAVRVYDGVAAELPAECIEAGVEAGRDAATDVIVGIGGGSCIDAAKVIALLLTHGGAMDDYYGELRIPGPILPVVAVPTTAGTGSEVTPVAVVADPGRAVKVGIASPYLIPETAICDPELTLSCPPGLTAASGADALVHAIEAFTNVRRTDTAAMTLEHVFVGKNALTDQHALGAITSIGRSLVAAVRTGDDLAARSDVMMGSMLAGLAFGSAGTSVCHAVQYPVGALSHTAHGLGVALMLPYALQFNRRYVAEEIATVGQLMGFANPNDQTDAAVDRAIDGIAAVIAEIGIPTSLEEIGIESKNLPWIAEQALGAHRLIKNNPRPVDRAGMDQLVAAAFSGERCSISFPVQPAAKAS
ncbi:alcohol dehydrogenase [Devosia pacifica]|uniref:Alcohol dehydrogenase n=1 Tax=Devosia pacifica TaxID=1335967 RepID=A0A918VQ93_9HYPH|nr:iron-containing alcohol dehydrogenase [Devosia pacifica]GHA18977.1 alcohol dehydrogenase [Devosia pacifica]